MDFIGKSDTFVVTRIDCLARSLGDLQDIVRKLAAYRHGHTDDPGSPVRPNERWSMDFVSDALFDGRWLRALTVMDAFTREALAIEVDGAIGSSLQIGSTL
ncbi:hypothetical protein LNAOJCKE_5371 [Methylorubrum aminovorans]|uniref:Integrase catalytic domain-containing protein n=1 Tax=Methylorubrum aminovorans TaxID=269069 RepID=A0ABQ4UQV0_9HYPH|nr:hypothetical protein LNAOJCKE_5371 [Methylorubrum aminovorans]GMA74033.1 hypothetical protein GCM10025880_04500 [Methylorubrum aminovorans]